MNEFFDLLGKQEKLIMAVLFVNSEKIVQQYIKSLLSFVFGNFR